MAQMVCAMGFSHELCLHKFLAIFDRMLHFIKKSVGFHSFIYILSFIFLIIIYYVPMCHVYIYKNTIL